MGTEIERKFRVEGDQWRREASRSVVMKQAYLGKLGRASVRIRTSGGRAFLNIKSATLGISRREYEYEIPLADAEEMLAELAEGAVIEKTRFYVQHGEHEWEIDEFDGANRGLVVAEIELGTENEAFDLPPWAGDEVSDDPRYYNVNLVRHPYGNW